MTIEANAIVGILLWLVAHERQHYYGEHGGKFALGLWGVAAFASAYFLALAGLRIVGWVS